MPAIPQAVVLDETDAAALASIARGLLAMTKVTLLRVHVAPRDGRGYNVFAIIPDMSAAMSFDPTEVLGLAGGTGGPIAATVRLLGICRDPFYFARCLDNATATAMVCDRTAEISVVTDPTGRSHPSPLFTYNQDTNALELTG